SHGAGRLTCWQRRPCWLIWSSGTSAAHSCSDGSVVWLQPDRAAWRLQSAARPARLTCCRPTFGTSSPTSSDSKSENDFEDGVFGFDDRPWRHCDYWACGNLRLEVKQAKANFSQRGASPRLANQAKPGKESQSLGITFFVCQPFDGVSNHRPSHT